MMSKLQVLDSLVGENVTIELKDRVEAEFYGELLEYNDLGATIKYSDHGREFVLFSPMQNINYISHKVISAK